MNSSSCIDQVPFLLSNDHTKVNKKKPQQKKNQKVDSNTQSAKSANIVLFYATLALGNV